MKVTDARLAEMRARCERATPLAYGWTVRIDADYAGRYEIQQAIDSEHESNRDFIQAARSDLPDVIDDLTEARKALAEAQAVVEQLTGLLLDCAKVHSLTTDDDLPDCIDNDNHPYQSAELDGVLVKELKRKAAAHQGDQGAARG